MLTNNPSAPSIHCPNAVPGPGLGIQRIVVDDNARKLLVTFTKKANELTDEQKTRLRSPSAYALTGGSRIFPRIVSVEISAAPAEITAELQLDEIGDFSIYTLTIGGPDVDSFFASHTLRFRLRCDDPFDCGPRKGSTAVPENIPVAIDYLTKDYVGFRQALLDFIPTRMPAWTERSEADIGIMLLELFSATADSLSYVQDRVANEAFLDTALQRRSVAGHLALIGYEMDQGASAFTWLRFQVSKTVTIHSPLAVSTKPVRADDPVIVFETHPSNAAMTLRKEHNELPVAGRTDSDCCLPRDALSLTLAGNYPNLKAGDYLLLDDGQGQRDIIRLTKAIGDPHHCMTTIQWSKATPLRFDYCVRSFDPWLWHGIIREIHPASRSFRVDPVLNARHQAPKCCTAGMLQLVKGAPITLNGRAVEINEVKTGMYVQYETAACGTQVLRMVVQPPPRLVLCGNLLPATHGETVEEPFLDPGVAPPEHPEIALRRGFQLRRAPLAYLHPKTPGLALPAPSFPGRPSRGISTLTVFSDGEQWQERSTLLESRTDDKHFRVEIDDAGDATIRFGNPKTGGAQPSRLETLRATYRVGGGTAGNIAADTLVQVRSPFPDGILNVTNPLPAVGGRDLESRDHARRFAPSSFKKSLVCLTGADFQSAAEEFVDSNGEKLLQRGKAGFRWTGSWYTVQLAVDPLGTRSLASAAREELSRDLDGRRLVGVDLEVTDRPEFVALEIAIEISLKSGFRASDVEAKIREALGSRAFSDGRKGLFHPDNFTFGQSLFVSRLLATLAGVSGVGAAGITRLCRFRFGNGATQTQKNLSTGRVDVGPDQILRMDDDRNFPENGTLNIKITGAIA